jgi:hypothetical protein
MVPLFPILTFVSQVFGLEVPARVNINKQTINSFQLFKEMFAEISYQVIIKRFHFHFVYSYHAGAAAFRPHGPLKVA